MINIYKRSILIAIVFLLRAEYGQSQHYQFSQSTDFFFEILNPISASNGTVWDLNSSFPLPIGFDFEFYGETFTSLSVKGGGYVTFDNNQRNIGPFYAYLVDRSNLTGNQNSTSPITYSTVGDEGSRILVVQWENAGFNAGSEDDFITFQLWLREADNSIEVRIGNVAAGDSYDGGAGETGPYIGLDNFATDNFFYLTGNPRTPQTTNAISTLNGTPEEGTVYRFAPDVVSSTTETNKQELATQLFPNPSGNVANISFNLKEDANVTIQLTDITGKQVDLIQCGELEQGKQTLRYDTSRLATGVYSIRIQTNDASASRVFLKR